MKNIPRIVLASQSARRQEILRHLGLDPKIIVSEADENTTEKLTPEALTEQLSVRKAEAILPLCDENDMVIAGDTVVALGDEIFGKPTDREDAFRMLSILSGTTHKVVSGIAVCYGGKIAVSHEVTEVTFRKISENELRAYIATGEPDDKAGAYGMQDKASVFVEKINGDYFNVVGLPVFKMFQLIKEHFDLSYFDFISEDN